MALTTLTTQDLYEEIADLARGQGAGEQGAWNELVDEVVDSYLDLGELDKDQDIEGMKDVLKAKWEAYKAEEAEETATGLREEGEEMV